MFPSWPMRRRCPEPGCCSPAASILLPRRGGDGAAVRLNSPRPVRRERGGGEGRDCSYRFRPEDPWLFLPFPPRRPVAVLTVSAPKARGRSYRFRPEGAKLDSPGQRTPPWVTIPQHPRKAQRAATRFSLAPDFSRPSVTAARWRLHFLYFIRLPSSMNHRVTVWTHGPKIVFRINAIGAFYRGQRP